MMFHSVSPPTTAGRTTRMNLMAVGEILYPELLMIRDLVAPFRPLAETRRSGP